MIGIERLKILARHLERLSTIPPTKRTRKFDLTNWFQNKYDFNGIAIKCGTSACAVGEACCCVPEFEEQGLSARFGNSGAWLWPKYNGHTEWAAVREFFDIDQDAAEHLFSGDAYSSPKVSPKTVADRIRKFIAKNN